MIVIDTFAKFVSHAAYAFPMTDWRSGQRAFNLLSQVRPDIAELLRGSDFDPFHDDSRLPMFYDFVQRHWGF